MNPPNDFSLDELLPESAKILLAGTGAQFLERLGIEVVREIVLGVMRGENLRTQTEPLTQQRIAQLSCALILLFARGWARIDNFTDEVSQMAVKQLRHVPRNNNASTWTAQWVLGLTSKSVQNVLRGQSSNLDTYTLAFEETMARAAEQSRINLGQLDVTMAWEENGKSQKINLTWRDIVRLTTAIGSQTLTIRGSDKSMFGKLFERLVLGSVLTVLDFERVNRSGNRKTGGVFWLSDSSDLRESDATLLYRPGKLVLFDIGFIGIGNSEISKDKLSRFAREIEISGMKHGSTTFVIVDRLPATSKTKLAADNIGAEIVQMSMQYWVRDLARRLGSRLGFTHPIQTLSDHELELYLANRLNEVQIQDFLVGVPMVAPTVDDELENEED